MHDYLNHVDTKHKRKLDEIRSLYSCRLLDMAYVNTSRLQSIKAGFAVRTQCLKYHEHLQRKPDLKKHKRVQVC